jgi:hypothetical protein
MVVMWSSAAAFNFDFVRAGTLLPMACFMSAFRGSSGQVEHLDAIAPLGQPGLDGLGMMGAQIVEDEKDFPGRVLDQRFEEFDQPVRAEIAVDDHPARLALVGHR